MKIMRKVLKIAGLLTAGGVLAFGQSTTQQGLVATAVAAQPCGTDLKPPALQTLAAKASDATDISLDPNTLQMAAKFLGNKGEDGQIQQTVNGLGSIYVRNLKFDKPGEYSAADYEEFRKQLQDPAWIRILNSKEKSGEITEIYMRRQNDKMCGMALISAEPKELTLISINGEINPDTLSGLKKLGIPVPNVKSEQK